MSRSAWLGGFFAASLFLLCALVILLGKKQSLFHRKVYLRTTFADTSGLVAGSAVRLAGVDVGVVERIAFDPDPRFRKVHVELAVSATYEGRIRADSMAHLTSKGLLGDMVIDIDLGSADRPVLHDGDELPSQESDSLTAVVRTLQDGVADIRHFVNVASGKVETTMDDAAVRDVHRTLHALADLSDEIAHGDNVAHALTHERALAADLRTIGAAASTATVHVARAADRVERILGSDEVQQMPTRATRVLEDADTSLLALRSGRGLLHSLLFEPGPARMTDDLGALARNLHVASDSLVRGDGTLGALLTDPTVYGDLKLILGNARRSAALRFLIRRAIRRDALRAH